MTPFFIVGSSRSGSTLLRLMLDSHSRIAIPSETWYIAALLEAFPCDRPLTENEISAAVSMMTSHYTWPDIGLDGAELRRRALYLSLIHI